MEVLAAYAFSASTVMLAVYTAYIRRKYGRPIPLLPSGLERSDPVELDEDIWGEAIPESLLGEVGLIGNNVTRLGPMGRMMAANVFSAKAEAVPEIVPAFSGGGKWDYWRTDWRKIPRRKV
jgi:hypothetical protein